MLQRRADGRYANTPETELYLDRNKPTYCGGMLEMMNARLYRFWGHLIEALQTGLPQNESRHGEPDLFGVLYRDAARLEQFLSAMTGLSRPTGRAIATAFGASSRRSPILAALRAGSPLRSRALIRI
jgi:hypothetical protein